MSNWRDRFKYIQYSINDILKSWTKNLILFQIWTSHCEDVPLSRQRRALDNQTTWIGHIVINEPIFFKLNKNNFPRYWWWYQHCRWFKCIVNSIVKLTNKIVLITHFVYLPTHSCTANDILQISATLCVIFVQKWFVFFFFLINH